MREMIRWKKYVMYNMAFLIPFLFIFFNTFTWNSDRAFKCVVSSILFSLVFSLMSRGVREIILPVLCGVLFYIATAGTFYWYFTSQNAGWCEVHYELFFAESLSCILILLTRLLADRIRLITIIEIPIIIISSIYILYYIIFDVSINSDTYFIIFQTNASEVMKFLWDYKIACILFLIFSVFISREVYRYNSSINFTEKRFHLIIPFVFLLGIVLINIKLVLLDSHLYIQRDFNIAYGYMQQSKNLSENMKDIGVVKSNSNIRNIVVVIGESANRDFMGAYGYERDNTPWMSKMSKMPNVVLFDKCYTSYRLTNKALAYMLTEKSQYNDEDVFSALNIVDVFKAAGFKTYWISDQGNISNFREIYNVIAQRADVAKFIEHGGDADLIDLLDIIDKDDKKVIFVHLQGSHHPYHNYPSEYQLYKNDSVNDRYDNTILYTDFILSEMYAKLKKINPDVFIYISDHGESKEMMRNIFNFRLSHVPFMMIFSVGFIENNTELYEQALQKRHTYFTHDMFYDTMLGMTGVDKQFYDDSANLFSPHYAYDKDNLKTEYGDVYIKDDPYDE